MTDPSRQIILFGTGTNGRVAFLQYGYENIAFYCSNNPKRWGEFFCGKKVISFDELKGIYKDYNIIVTVQTYVSLTEIEKQLKDAGIPFSTFVPDHVLGFFVTTIDKYNKKADQAYSLYQILKLEMNGIHVDSYLREQKIEGLPWTEMDCAADYLYWGNGFSESYSKSNFGARKLEKLRRLIEDLYFQKLIRPDGTEGEFE